MIFFIVISWILQATGITTKDKDETVVPLNGLGLLDSMTAVWLGFKKQVEIILFLFAIGGLLSTMTRIKALDAGVQALIKRMKGKEILMIPLLMLIFGLGGTTYGMWEETVTFLPVVISVYVRIGYGALAAVMTVLLGAGVGTMASTVNPFAVGVAALNLGQDSDSQPFSQGTMMGMRWLTWVLLMALAISFVTFIAIKTKKKQFNLTGINQAKINDKFVNKEEIIFTTRRKLAVILFVTALFLMILSYLPWTVLFGQQALKNATARADKYLFWLARSSMWEGGWGHWYFVSIAAVFTMVTIIIFLINKREFTSPTITQERVFINTFITGAKDMLGVSLLIAVASGLGIILKKSNIGLLIANSTRSLQSAGLVGFAVVIFLLSILLSFFIPSTSGFASAFIPIFAAIARKAFGPSQIQAAYGLIIMGFILASGLVNLISPTSAALIAYTNYCEIPYSFWMKKMWPFVLVITTVSLLLILFVGGLVSHGITF